VAAVVGGDWPFLATQAATILSGGRDADDDSLPVRLLKDIRGVFEASDADRFASKTLCEKLAAIEDAPWNEIRRGKSISQNQLARLLDPFKVKSGTIREGNLTRKGYLLESFREVFASYFPDSKRHSVTPQRAEGESDVSQSVTSKDCDVTENASLPYGQKGCDGVTDRKEENEREGFEL
jgi:hypothetical protein